MTEAEARLWQNLRRHGLAGYKFRRQHPFGPYILDFYCPAARLAVEVDGGQHFKSENLLQDGERTRYLEERGFTVLRFTNVEALSDTDAVLNAIFQALSGPSPRPSPPRGRGSCEAGRSRRSPQWGRGDDDRPLSLTLSPEGARE